MINQLMSVAKIILILKLSFNSKNLEIILEVTSHILRSLNNILKSEELRSDIITKVFQVHISQHFMCLVFAFFYESLLIDCDCLIGSHFITEKLS